ncbi:MAG: Uncharacterised protein [SAR116 cluster bacterium]|nr:MAG: Uncharacterised protein [SAR116 cluster bacterium]
MRCKAAIGIQRKGGAIIDNLVLPADQRHIDQRQAGFRYPCHSVGNTLVPLADLERRSIDRHNHLGTGLGKTFDNIRAPDILADWQSQPPSPDHDRPRHLSGGKIPAIVKDAVGWQPNLVAAGLDLAVIQHKHAVIDLAVTGAGSANNNRRAAISRQGGKLVQPGRNFSHEITPQHQIIALIAGQIHFWRNDDLRPACLRLRARFNQPRNIGGDVAHMRVQLRQRNGIRLCLCHDVRSLLAQKKFSASLHTRYAVIGNNIRSRIGFRPLLWQVGTRADHINRRTGK